MTMSHYELKLTVEAHRAHRKNKENSARCASSALNKALQTYYENL